MDVVPSSAVHAERERAGARGDSQRRAGCRDSADATVDVRDPAYLTRGQLDAIDVADAVGIADEVDRLAVGRPLRIHLFGGVAARVCRADDAGLELQQSDTQLAEAQIIEQTREPIRREGDRLAVG